MDRCVGRPHGLLSANVAFLSRGTDFPISITTLVPENTLNRIGRAHKAFQMSLEMFADKHISAQNMQLIRSF